MNKFTKFIFLSFVLIFMFGALSIGMQVNAHGPPKGDLQQNNRIDNFMHWHRHGCL